MSQGREKKSKIIMKLHLTIHTHSVSSIAQSSGIIGKGFFLFVCFPYTGGLLC